MSHCIFAIVVRAKDIPSDKAGFFRKTDHEDYLITSDSSAVFNDLQLSCPRVQLQTDYFGGAGEQSATYFDEQGPNTSFAEGTRGGPINAALRMLGVPESPDKDLFDVIGLGRFRDQRDLEQPVVTMTREDHAEMITTLEDLRGWRSIIRLRAGETLPPKEFTEQDMSEMETLADKALTLARKGILSEE